MEREAGLFVLGAVVGSLVSAIGIAVQRGWFESHKPVMAILKNAEGIHPGTVVQMAGLRAGSVDDVELQTDNSVRVRLMISERFFDRLRMDSKVQTLRPFIIGEKVLDLTLGTNTSAPLEPGQTLATVENLDVMDLLSGKKMGPLVETLAGLADTMKTLMEAFADADRTRSFIETYDKMGPLITNMNAMAVEVNGMTKDLRKAKVHKVVENLYFTVREVNKLIPEVQNGGTLENVQLLVTNLAVLTTEMQKLVPTINAIAPELPRTSLRAVEGLNELVITLKAMQKSFLLRGSVSDVKEEEAKQRAPASGKPAP